MSTIIIKNGSVITLNDQKQNFQKGYVLIENDLIAEVGAGDLSRGILKSRSGAGRSQYGRHARYGQCPHPSFPNLIRGLADDKPLLEWLEAAIWPVAKR